MSTGTTNLSQEQRLSIKARVFQEIAKRQKEREGALLDAARSPAVRTPRRRSRPSQFDWELTDKESAESLAG